MFKKDIKFKAIYKGEEVEVLTMPPVDGEMIGFKDGKVVRLEVEHIEPIESEEL